MAVGPEDCIIADGADEEDSSIIVLSLLELPSGRVSVSVPVSAGVQAARSSADVITIGTNFLMRGTWECYRVDKFSWSMIALKDEW